jgi:hypothetical protein
LEPIKNKENNNNEAIDEEYKIKQILKRKLEQGQIFPSTSSTEEKALIRQCYQDCFEEVEEHVEKAEAEEEFVFGKEHRVIADPVFQARFMFGQDSVKESPWMVQIPHRYGLERTHSSNETFLPDEYLRTWCPIFLIRHPALAFPSRYRAFLDMEDATSMPEGRRVHLSVNLTFHWTRSLYDWYSQHFSESGSPSAAGGVTTWPIVLDADDIICEPSLCVRLAEIMGIDSEKLRFSWSPLSQEGIGNYVPNARRLLSTLHASGGIEKGKAAVNIDIDSEANTLRAVLELPCPITISSRQSG